MTLYRGTPPYSHSQRAQIKMVCSKCNVLVFGSIVSLRIQAPLRQTGESVPLLPFPQLERHWLEWKLHHFKGDSIGQRVPLALARVPNIAGREPIEAFTPSYLRVRLAVDIHVKVVSEREAKTISEDVTDPIDKSREHCLARPRGTAVGRGPVVDIPMRLVALIHPGDPYVSGCSGCDRRERMVNPKALGSKRDIGFRTPSIPLVRGG